MRRSHILAVVLMTLLGLGFAFSQSTHREKLHPEFQSLVSPGMPAGALKNAAGLRSPAGLTKEGEPLYDAIITTTNADAIRAGGLHLNSVVGKFATAQLTRADLLRLVQMDEVQYLCPGSINYPALDVSVPEIGANLLHAGLLNNSPYKGKGVIVLIYDTGIDWRHLDFRDPADPMKSRILAIWDQTLTAAQTGEAPPQDFSYGVEYTKQQIEAEFKSSPPNFVQEKDINGHGTHVAGTAAGNGSSLFKKYVGVAPEADIIVVKGGDGSFPDSKVMDGFTYAANKASALGKPIVVNMSLGTLEGPHDGTWPTEVALNNFVASSGRAVAISAGNDGGRTVHASGTLSLGGSTTILINVPAYTPQSGTNNDTFVLEVWFDTNLGVTATASSPNNIKLIVGTDDANSAGNESDGSIDLENYGSPNSPNGNRYVLLKVSDKGTNVPRSGTWTLTLSGSNATTNFNAWLSSYTVGSSAVTIMNGDNQKTVETPGNATGAITVGSYVTKNSWTDYYGRPWSYASSVTTGSISTFSSIGPTADGRQKPDIAAPGQGIASSLSSSVDTSTIGSRIMPGLKDYLIQGTSMASPHVVGVAALLLQAKPSLSVSQAKSYITSTARTDGYMESVPNTTWGYGKVDAFKAVEKAIGAVGGAHANVSYAGEAKYYTLLPSDNLKMATRFTPTISGKLVSVSIMFNGAKDGIKGSGSLKVSGAQNVSGSIGGIPGTQLGSSVLIPFSSLTGGVGSWNNVDMSSSNISVTNGIDFHVVVEVAGAAGDTLQVLLDDGTTSPTNRSSAYRTGVNGLRWYNFADPNYSSGATPSFNNLLLTATIASISVVDVEKQPNIVPATYQLFDNYPNPFNPSTSIRYSVPVQSRIRLRVFDLIGREVASLVDEQQAPGNYAVNWHGTDNAGVPLSTGVYFYRLESAGQQLTKKMILLK